MKRIFTLLLCALLCQALGAQTGLAELAVQVASSRVSLDYTCSIQGKTKINGKVLAQQNCYRASLPGMEIICDGTTRWTVDNEAKEVYIEASEGIKELLDNAEGYLAELKDLNITNVKTSPIDDDLSAFIIDVAALGKDWLVQDLR